MQRYARGGGEGGGRAGRKTNLCAPWWADTGRAPATHSHRRAHVQRRPSGQGSGALQTTPITTAVNTGCPTASWESRPAEAPGKLRKSRLWQVWQQFVHVPQNPVLECVVFLRPLCGPDADVCKNQELWVPVRSVGITGKRRSETTPAPGQSLQLFEGPSLIHSSEPGGALPLPQLLWTQNTGPPPPSLPPTPSSAHVAATETPESPRRREEEGLKCDCVGAEHLQSPKARHRIPPRRASIRRFGIRRYTLQSPRAAHGPPAPRRHGFPPAVFSLSGSVVVSCTAQAGLSCGIE
uniref:Uncharacterized protein n=1 Tax=Knipowitschia caucasica TaxID=637954 RepID=A0AAV2JJK9_KNICA